MKKYGKYEKLPEGATQKPVKVKSMLLQTYLTSLLCMVLCVTMFFGTSYAWFTSEVSNNTNEIYIGTLAVGLYKQVPTDAGVEMVDLSQPDTKLFDNTIRWEPGYTALETIDVVNEGDLAFKYVMNFTLPENSVLNAAADQFDVWVYNHRRNGGAPTPGAYRDITADDSGWVHAGSLAALLSGDPVLFNDMYSVRDDKEDTPAVDGTTDGLATTDTYTIALHMQESANDPALMGQKISLNVKLVAYQMSYEEDAMDNLYDQMVGTPAELAAACQQGGMIVLAADINMDETRLSIPSGVTAILDLNGHNISGTVAEPASLITNEGDLTIQGNGKIEMIFTGAPGDDAAANAISNRGVLTVNGGEFSTTCVDGRVGYAIDNYNGAVLTFNDGKVTASGNYTDGIRLFCGSNDTLVTVNGGEISSIWAQNPTANKATEVKGTVVVNGGTITTVYYENYTTVKIAADVATAVTPYGAGKDNTTNSQVDGYTVFTFVHE